MARHLAFNGMTRPGRRGVSSFACLGFVVLLATAFWAGAVWIGQHLLQIGALGF